MLAELREHVLSKLCSVITTALSTLELARTEVTSKLGRRCVLRLAALDVQAKGFTLCGRNCCADCLQLTPRSRRKGQCRLQKEQPDC